MMISKLLYWNLINYDCEYLNLVCMECVGFEVKNEWLNLIISWKVTVCWVHEKV